MANQILEEFEEYIGHGSTPACKLLGIAYPTYAAYRNESRELPTYHVNHIDTIYRLPARSLKQLINERTE